MKTTMLLLSAALGLMTISGVQAAEDNVHFSGALVTEPCVLPDSDKDIHLDFGTVIEKYLYQYQRTKSQPFSIHLMECDPAVLSSVSVTFQGTADTELTDMLALDASGTAKGVVIGLEMTDGTPLVINDSIPYKQLASGTNVLTFNAFVQIQPSAMVNRSLVAGDFIAVSTFLLAYQ